MGLVDNEEYRALGALDSIAAGAGNRSRHGVGSRFSWADLDAGLRGPKTLAFRRTPAAFIVLPLMAFVPRNGWVIPGLLWLGSLGGLAWIVPFDAPPHTGFECGMARATGEGPSTFATDLPDPFGVPTLSPVADTSLRWVLWAGNTMGLRETMAARLSACALLIALALLISALARKATGRWSPAASLLLLLNPWALAAASRLETWGLLLGTALAAGSLLTAPAISELASSSRAIGAQILSWLLMIGAIFCHPLASALPMALLCLRPPRNKTALREAFLAVLPALLAFMAYPILWARTLPEPRFGALVGPTAMELPSFEPSLGITGAVLAGTLAILWFGRSSGGLLGCGLMAAGALPHTVFASPELVGRSPFETGHAVPLALGTSITLGALLGFLRDRASLERTSLALAILSLVASAFFSHRLLTGLSRGASLRESALTEAISRLPKLPADGQILLVAPRSGAREGDGHAPTYDALAGDLGRALRERTRSGPARLLFVLPEQVQALTPLALSTLGFDPRRDLVLEPSAGGFVATTDTFAARMEPRRGGDLEITAEAWDWRAPFQVHAWQLATRDVPHVKLPAWVASGADGAPRFHAASPADGFVAPALPKHAVPERIQVFARRLMGSTSGRLVLMPSEGGSPRIFPFDWPSEAGWANVDVTSASPETGALESRIVILLGDAGTLVEIASVRVLFRTP